MVKGFVEKMPAVWRPGNGVNRSEAITYLTNACGEETGYAVEPPQEVLDWFYNVAWHGECANWLEYLVVYKGEFFMAAILELSHRGSVENGDPRRECLLSFDDARVLAMKAAARVEYDVFLGKESGIFGRHEVAILIPFGAPALDGLLDDSLTRDSLAA